MLLESLKLKLRLQPTLRRQAAEACAEGIIGGFEHGQREQALAAFDSEHAAVRAKYFPKPPVEQPAPEPLSAEDKKKVLPFDLKKDAW